MKSKYSDHFVLIEAKLVNFSLLNLEKIMMFRMAKKHRDLHFKLFITNFRMPKKNNFKFGVLKSSSNFKFGISKSQSNLKLGMPDAKLILVLSMLMKDVKNSVTIEFL